MIVTKSKFVQPSLVIVQLNTFAPCANPFTVVVFKFEFVNVPAPEISFHSPMPVNGSSPFNTVLFVQIVWTGPASTLKLLLVTLISVSSEQVPLVTVQRKVVVPPFTTPVISVSNCVLGATIVPLPPTISQYPEPPKLLGSFPFNVKFELQSLWSVATAVTELFVIKTSSASEQIPFETVHVNVVVPIGNPVTWDVSSDGVTTIAAFMVVLTHEPIPWLG